jgi:cytochrome P450
MCCLAAANRDPAKWDRPDAFDVRRQTLGQLAFGTGIHACIGQMVARLEAEAILAALLRHVDAIALNGPATHRLSNVSRRLATLPLRVTLKTQ